MTPEDWSPATTSTSTFLRSSIEPRDERVQIPRTRERAALRPKPLNIAATRHPRPSPPELRAPPPSRKESSESQRENLRDPEVVDSAFSEAWAARDSALRTRRPSITSWNSTRQSEISLGIIDYYMRDHTPAIPSPELPPTPKIDPAIDRFDFGLPPTPTPSAAPRFQDSPPAKAGAERAEQLISISPPTRPPASTNNSYRLFPVIKQVTPPPRYVALTLSYSYPTTNAFLSRQPTIISPLPLAEVTPPSTSYRPRKESITSSARSRNDSLLTSSTCSGAGATPKAKPHSRPQRTPPSSRILSSDSTSTATTATRRMTSNSTTKPPQPPCTSPDLLLSRWSDDTITSPVVAPTPGPRTSFGSLLRRDSGTTVSAYGSTQYPACFFEDDDDEDVPLRRRFGSWRKTGSSVGSSTVGQRERGKGGWWRWLGCGCAGR